MQRLRTTQCGGVSSAVHAQHTQSLRINSLTCPTVHPLSAPSLQRLPPAIIDIALELTRNKALNAAVEPHLAQQRIVAFLIEEQLVVAAQRGVDFTVFVKVGGHGPGTMILIEKENHTFANVDEDSDLTAAPGEGQ